MAVQRVFSAGSTGSLTFSLWKHGMKLNSNTNEPLFIHLYPIYSPDQHPSQTMHHRPVCFLDCGSHGVSISLLLHPPGDVFHYGLMSLILVTLWPFLFPSLSTDQCQLLAWNVRASLLTIKMTTTQSLMFAHSAPQSDPSEHDTICLVPGTEDKVCEHLPNSAII